jgi:6-pyruvoyltetrahydropterin/6-carboxytetrahydropterin synthase
MLTATRRFTFDAAHHLPRHAGKCKQIHGHTYILEVTVCATERAYETFDDQGFFVDFGDLKSAVTCVIDKLCDHKDLNEFDSYPTAERLILRLWKCLSATLPPTCELVHLRLHETPNSWIEYDGHDDHFSHINALEREAQMELFE